LCRLTDIGFAELWGTDIVHCMICGGYEHKDKSCATIGISRDKELDSAMKALSVASSVHLFPNLEDPDLVPVEMEKKLRLLKAGGVTIMPFKYIVKISKDSPDDIVIHLSDGSQHRVGWIVLESGTFSRAAMLAVQLRLQVNLPSTGIKVGDWQETTVRGVFAAGDCVSMSKHVPSAVNDGFIAGEGVHLQLTMEDLEEAASNVTE
jgi:thioredoxin reductase